MGPISAVETSSSSSSSLNSKPLMMRHRSRLETNLTRLLSRCEGMAMDTQGLQDNWRLPKYVDAAEVMLKDLKSGPNIPEKDVLLEYGRRIDFIKGILHASKMPSAVEKAVASQLISPSSSSSISVSSPDFNSTRGMEIKHRHLNKYSEDMRKELLGESDGSSSAARRSITGEVGGVGSQQKPEEIDELLKYHHSMQEKIAEHMIELTRSLKEQAMTAGQIIKTDTESLEKSAKLMDINQGNLKAESERLEMYNKSACKCWVWVLLVVVCSMFVGMVLFMRLFKKRLVV